MRVRCGLSSSVTCIASISVWFRSKERGARVKERLINGTLFHFLALVIFLTWSKPKIPFLGLSLLRNQTKTLATQASSSVVYYCDRKTSLHNTCYFFMFSRQAKTHSAKWARSVRHTQWGKATMVCRQALFFLCLPHHGCLTLQAHLMQASAHLKNVKKYRLLCRAYENRPVLVSSLWPQIACCMCQVQFFIPTFQPK